MFDSDDNIFRDGPVYDRLSDDPGDDCCQQRVGHLCNDALRLFYSVYQWWDKDNKANSLGVSDWVVSFAASAALIGGSTIIRWFYSSCVKDNNFKAEDSQSLLFEELMLFLSSLISHVVVRFFLYRVIRKLESQLKEEEGAYPLLNNWDNLTQWVGFIYFFCVKVVSGVIPSFVFKSFMNTIHGDDDSIDCNNLSVLTWVVLPLGVLAATILIPNALQDKINGLKKHKQSNYMTPHLTQCGEEGVHFLTIPPHQVLRHGNFCIFSGAKGRTVTIQEVSSNDEDSKDIEGGFFQSN